SALPVRSLRRPPTPTLFPYTTLFRSALDDQLRLGRQRFAWLHPLLGVMVCDSYARQWCRVIDAAEEIVHCCAESHSQSLDECQRSEEHTSELQSRENLVCRLLLEKKK